MAIEQAISTETFIQTLGVNTHLDFGGSYANVPTVEAAINYLGLDNLRDSPRLPGDLTLWQQVAQATGAKFDAYVSQVWPSGMPTELGYMQQLAQEGILNFIEGGDEEDDSYPTSVGNSLAQSAQFQQTLYAAAQSLGVPTINMSFGAGWTAANNWIGDYANVGDLSAFADYANAHTYPSGAPDTTIQQLNADALLAASSRPVISTEFGYNISSTDPTQATKWTLDAALDGMKDGDVKTYFYALFDDQSGNFGLMNPDGSPRPAGVALHNLTTLLQDSGGTINPGSLDYTLDNTAAGDNSLLMEKSDGTYWLALWNESNSGHTVTLNLSSTATAVEVFDPLTGTTAVQTADNTNSVQITVPDHPVMVEIVPSGAQTTSPAPPSTTGSAAPPPSTTSSPSGDVGLTVPASLQAAPGQPQPISGVTLNDAYAADNGSQVTVTISDASGSLSAIDAWGNTQQGSTLTLSGTIWQVNAALANLSYTADGSNDTITIAAADQAGDQTSQSITVTDSGSGSGGSTPAAPPPSADNGMSIAVPASLQDASGGSVAVTGVSISDPYALGNADIVSVTIADQSGGTISTTDAWGNPQQGSGTGGLTLSGTVWQVNADLANLQYSGGTDTLTFTASDQAGNSASASIAVNGSSTPPPTGNAIQIAAGEADPVETVDSTVITASAGDHMIFIAGTGDTLTATGGTESIQAYQGGNTVTTGAGNDTIRFSGSGNTIDAGGGNNQLEDSGNNNTIVLPGTGQGYDNILGWVTQNGDSFDLRPALAQTSWNGSTSTLGNYVQVSMSGDNAIVSIGGAAVATLNDATNTSLSSFLAHAIT